MKKAIVVLAVFAMLVFASPLPAHNDTVDRAHKTTHEIELDTILQQSQCSATAIGPHALLTASHCELPTSDITIDGDDAKILALTRDDQDHTIYLVDATFKDWSVVSTDKPEVGDHVFIFGNPGELNDIYREGYLTGFRPVSAFAALFGVVSPTVYLYDMNAWHGDSGAAIFNEKGQISGVVSIITSQSEKEEPGVNGMKLTAGLGLAFSSKQLSDAASFTGQ
jgi:V8-like Glu-specific endopeptidase